MTSKDFALRMSRARTELGMSQEALAEAVGVNARTIGRWENESGVTTLNRAYRVSQALGISLDDEPSKRSDLRTAAELLKQAHKAHEQACKTLEQVCKILEQHL